MWQQCPQCKGSGMSSSLISSYTTCSVCKGTKIINELTGLPPNVVQSSNITFGPLPEKYVGQGLEDFDMETQQKYFGK